MKKNNWEKFSPLKVIRKYFRFTFITIVLSIPTYLVRWDLGMTILNVAWIIILSIFILFLIAACSYWLYFLLKNN